jgi:hypothetical protein
MLAEVMFRYGAADVKKGKGNIRQAFESGDLRTSHM